MSYQMIFNQNEFEQVAREVNERNPFLIGQIDFIKKELMEELTYMGRNPLRIYVKTLGFKITRNPPDSYFKFSISCILNETT